MKLLCFVFVAIILGSCNNSTPTATTPKSTEKNEADSLMAQVMQGHDVAMGKMMKINDTQKLIKQVIDSLAKLPAASLGKIAAYKIQLDSTSARLTTANQAMDDWMSKFNMDSSLNETDKRVKYFESEKGKITAITDSMINGLHDADVLLKKD